MNKFKRIIKFIVKGNCSVCGGSGWIGDLNCPACNGPSNA